MNLTERSIFQQFDFWRNAPISDVRANQEMTYIVVGCGTSYYLAQSIASLLNLKGCAALAVPGDEWVKRPQAYMPVGKSVHVLALSRSGESTETVMAAKRSRAAGLPVTVMTCAAGSSLTLHADTLLVAETHADEGIVMTASASLMLLMGLRFAGYVVTEEHIKLAESLLHRMDVDVIPILGGRSHFVFLGGGELYGIAQEGALKLQEMSLTYTQAYHPLEYRHGPISLVDERTLLVMLYHADTQIDEQILVDELASKGALVVGMGGKGTVSLPLDESSSVRCLIVLPALQLLGERIAQAKGLDTRAPRHLTKVVRVA